MSKTSFILLIASLGLAGAVVDPTSSEEETHESADARPTRFRSGRGVFHDRWAPEGPPRRRPFVARRLALGSDAPDSSPENEPDVDADDFDPKSFDPMLEKQKMLARWHERLARHENEPTDRAWSGEAEMSFDRDRQPMAEQLGARLLETDCRTTTCVSRLEFTDYGGAVDGFDGILHHDCTHTCSGRPSTIGRDVVVGTSSAPRGPNGSLTCRRCCGRSELRWLSACCFPLSRLDDQPLRPGDRDRGHHGLAVDTWPTRRTPHPPSLRRPLARTIAAASVRPRTA